MERLKNFSFFPYILYLAIIACLSVAGALYFKDATVIFSAFLFSFLLMIENEQQGFRILITGFIALLTCFIATIINNFYLIICFFILLIFALSWVTSQRLNVKLNGYLILLITVMIAFYPITNQDHLVPMGCSFIIVFLSQFILTNRVRKKFYEKKCYALLKSLSQAIFDCFIDEDYVNNQYQFEYRIHKHKHLFLQWLSRLENVTSHEVIMQKLKNLYDITLDYGLLRTRINDYSTFPLCRQEMIKINADIHEAYSAIITNQVYDETKLSTDLEIFENQYEQVLQIAAREPYVFILFIESIKALIKCLENKAC